MSEPTSTGPVSKPGCASAAGPYTIAAICLASCQMSCPIEVAMIAATTAIARPPPSPASAPPSPTTSGNNAAGLVARDDTLVRIACSPCVQQHEPIYCSARAVLLAAQVATSYLLQKIT